MASDDRQSDRSLSDRLRQEPEAFDFDQAVRLAERLRPGARPLGEEPAPAREAVRFAVALSPAATARPVEAVTADADADAPARIVVNPAVILDGEVPLTPHFSALVARRSRAGDDGPRELFEIFQHRFLSLLVRLRRRLGVTIEDRAPEDGVLARHAGAVAGVAVEASAQGQQLPRRAAMHLAGSFIAPSRSLLGLEQVLSRFLGVPVACRPFTGGWYGIAERDWTRLGPGGQNQKLGGNAVLGRRTWQQDWRCEVTIGPVGQTMLRDVIPGGPNHGALRELVRLYLPPGLDVDLRLLADGEDLPLCRLTRENAPRLGYTTFLHRDGGRHPDAVVSLPPVNADLASG